MGLGSFLKKAADPFGHHKKAKKELKRAADKSGLSKIANFEAFNLKHMLKMLKENPERALLGAADPLSSKAWGEVTGKDYDPIINQYGGASKGSMQAAMDSGIDIGPTSTAHGIAQAVASIYAGGYGADALGGLTAGGGTLGGAAGGAGQAALETAVPAAMNMGAAAFEETPEAAGWQNGPGEYMGPLTSASREYDNGLGGMTDWDSFDPYTYGQNEGERLFVGAAEGGHMKEGAAGQQAEAQEIVDTIEQVSKIPGGAEMLFTMASKEKGGKGSKQVRMFNIGGPVQLAKGGLAAAEATRSAGRGDDSMMLHVSPEEYEAIESMWGKAEINPKTGIPEYGFLSDVWKKVKGAVKKIIKSPLFSFIAPMALNVFAPGLGAAIGGKLFGLSGAAATTAGNTAIQAGLGAASGGKEGALSGALSGLTAGGAGAGLASKLGMSGKLGETAGNALLGGIGGEIGGGGFAQGALGNVMNSMQMKAAAPMNEAMEGTMRDIFKPGNSLPTGGGLSTGEMSPVTQGSLTGGPGGAPVAMSPIGNMPTEQPGMLSRGWDWIKENPALAAGGAGALYSMMGSGGGGDKPPGLPDEFTQSLPSYSFDREQSAPGGDIDYYTYGQAGGNQEGEHQFFSGNSIGGQTPAGGEPLVGADYGDNPAMAQIMGQEYGGDSFYASAMRKIQEKQRAKEAAEQQGSGPAAPSPAPVMDQARLQQIMAALGQGAGQHFADGGHSKGEGSGREDTIEALLSDGEYVMDAETVSMLGDGSNDHGAARLDEMREELRKHKGKKLSKGEFSADAKRPLEYMKGGRAAYAEGGQVTEEMDSEMLADHIQMLARGEG